MILDDATIASRLARSLPTARWFADKAASIASVILHERVAITAGSPVELVLADVHLVDLAPVPRYVAVIGLDGLDAAATPAAAGWLVEMALNGSSLAGRHGNIVGHSVDRRAARVGHFPPADALTVMPIGGDASNTSFVVRSRSAGWIVKLFRRCRDGIQPEVELGDFFAAASPWPGTPRLCGWLEYVPADGPLAAASTALATVHEFAAGYTTGWDQLVGLLSSSPSGVEPLAGATGNEVLAIVAALGRATGQMHQALAARPDLPDFAPESTTPAGRQATAMGMAAHAEQVFTLIESRRTQFAPAIASRLAAVLAARSRLMSRFDSLPRIVGATSDIRVHGDYHLGQVLVVAHDTEQLAADHSRVLVIDFEGEPGRSLAERRSKTAAAKDVAGMCRSFDYLLRHVAKSTCRPYAAADLEHLETCYLDAYRAVAVGQPWWPAHRATADTLLAVFKLDKAIYELAYELNNRPDWIDVPLAAVEEAAG